MAFANAKFVGRSKRDAISYVFYLILVNREIAGTSKTHNQCYSVCVYPLNFYSKQSKDEKFWLFVKAYMSKSDDNEVIEVTAWKRKKTVMKLVCTAFKAGNVKLVNVNSPECRQSMCACWNHVCHLQRSISTNVLHLCI